MKSIFLLTVILGWKSTYPEVVNLYGCHFLYDLGIEETAFDDSTLLCLELWPSFSELFSLRYINGLVQERRNSIANALELRLSCTKPSIWVYNWNRMEMYFVPTYQWVSTRKTLTPLLMHWSYIFLALTHIYIYIYSYDPISEYLVMTCYDKSFIKGMSQMGFFFSNFILSS